MQMTREFKKVSIEWPDSFYAKEVEIIVIPGGEGRVDDKNQWKKFFYLFKNRI